MADDPKPGNDDGDTGTVEFAPITSQDDLNRIIGDRVARVKGQFSDYDDLKAKAAKFDEYEDANKSEQDRLTDEVAKARTEAEAAKAEALRYRVATKHGISDEDAELFLTGADEETLGRQAQRLSDRVDQRKKNNNHVPGEGGNPPVGGNDLRQFAADLHKRGG